MSYKVKETLKNEEKEMRAVYCKTLCDMAREDSRICALDADLIGSSGMQAFFKEFPDRAVDCGIQEANMVGMAAGLSAAGMVPFAHSFAPFATRRVMDQIFISCAYGKQNVRIVGSDPGVTAAYNGGTHMPFEDMGCLMSIPKITLIEPCDSVQLEQVIKMLQQKSSAIVSDSSASPMKRWCSVISTERLPLHSHVRKQSGNHARFALFPRSPPNTVIQRKAAKNSSIPICTGRVKGSFQNISPTAAGISILAEKKKPVYESGPDCIAK